MLNIKQVYIHTVLFIIFITITLTINIIISKKEDIISNTNSISLFAIIIMILFVFYNIFIYKPQNKILKEYDEKINAEKKFYINDNKFIKKKCELKKNIIKKKCDNINDDNYQNLLHGEYIDELENENFYKSKNDYHNIEKYVHENYLSK
tara:strand:- start:445 stop:894 length:450 start_codon:yes stop_codon:yes gene_type:complete